jgi:hypothetical protein
MGDLGALLESRPVSLGSTISSAVTCPGSPPLGILGRGLAEFPGSPELRQAWRGMMHGWQAKGEVARQLHSSSRLVEEMAGRWARRMESVRLTRLFADDDFGHRFETAARMIAAGFPSRLYHLGAGKFDTHADQLGSHGRELASLDAGLDAFLTNLQVLECPVVVMVYSEFGRRVGENFSGGTDHGAGGLAWLAGAGVEGGVHGPGYGLHQLDDGDVRAGLDYRQLYRRAITSSFGPGLADKVLGAAAGSESRASRRESSR